MKTNQIHQISQFHEMVQQSLSIHDSPHDLHKRKELWLSKSTNDEERSDHELPKHYFESSFKGHDESINKVVFSPNGDFLATASSEKVKLWDMKTFGIITTLSGHSNQVTTIAFPPYSGGKSSTLASGSLDQTVKLWDISSGELQETITFNHMVHYVTFTPTGFAADGNVIAVSNDSNVKLCETGTFLTTSFRGHTSAIKAIAFAPDGHFVATASDDLTIKLWNRKTSCLETTIVGEEKAISCMKVSPDERIIATASSNSVKLWDIKTQQFVAKIINKEGCVNNIRFCSDGKTIAIAGYDSLKLVDYQGNVKKTLDGYHDHVQDMLLDKQIVVKTNRSGETCLLNSENGKLIKSFPGSCPCISSHGKFIATITSGLAVTGGALAIIIWSLLTFERVAILPCSPQLDSLEKIAFSADDNTIAAHGYRNNFVQLWDIKGNLLAVLEHQDWVTDIVFAPDGNTLATAAHGVIVYLWEGTSNTKTWLLKRELSNVDTTLRCRGLVLDGALNLSDINQNVLEQRRTKISDDDDDDEQEEEEEKDQQIYYDRNIPTFDYLDFFKKLGYSTIRDGDGSHDLGNQDSKRVLMLDDSAWREFRDLQTGNFNANLNAKPINNTQQTVKNQSWTIIDDCDDRCDDDSDNNYDDDSDNKYDGYNLTKEDYAEILENIRVQRVFEAVKRSYVSYAEFKEVFKADDIHKRDENDLPLLYIAIQFNQISIVKLLLESGADPADQENLYGHNSLQLAIRDNDILDFKLIEMLVQANPEAINNFNYRGLTCLHQAIDLGNIPLVMFFLKFKADINARKIGVSPIPLIFAVAKFKSEIFQLLLDQGADYTITTSQGQTVLSFAEKIALKLVQDLNLDSMRVSHFITPENLAKLQALIDIGNSLEKQYAKDLRLFPKEVTFHKMLEKKIGKGKAVFGSIVPGCNLF